MGKADFIALGRTSIAEPEWVEKLRRGEPPRRCLACNTCVNEMRGGSQLRCVVNGARRARDRFVAAQAAVRRAHRGDRRGAGRPDLCVAGRRRQHRHRVRARRACPAARSATPARRRCSRRSSARESSFDRYIANQVNACTRKGVTFRYRTDVARVARPAGAVRPDRDRERRQIPLRPWPAGDADARLGRRRAGRASRRSSRSEAVRDWFYHRARKATGERFKALAKPGAEGHGDRRRAHGGQEPAGDRQRIRGGAAGRRT